MVALHQSQYKIHVQVSLNIGPCTGMCFWVCVFGCVFLGVCFWVCMLVCICLCVYVLCVYACVCLVIEENKTWGADECLFVSLFLFPLQAFAKYHTPPCYT